MSGETRALRCLRVARIVEHFRGDFPRVLSGQCAIGRVDERAALVRIGRDCPQVGVKVGVQPRRTVAARVLLEGQREHGEVLARLDGLE